MTHNGSIPSPFKIIVSPGIALTTVGSQTPLSASQRTCVNCIPSEQLSNTSSVQVPLGAVQVGSVVYDTSVQLPGVQVLFALVQVLFALVQVPPAPSQGVCS